MSEKIITEEEKQMLHVLNDIPNPESSASGFPEALPPAYPAIDEVFKTFADALHALVTHPFCPDELGADLIDVVFNHASRLGVNNAAMTVRHHLIEAGVLLAEHSESYDDAA